MTARYIEIFELFTNAAMHLRHPAMHMRRKNGDKIRIYLATKGYIAIALNGEYIGKLPAAYSKPMVVISGPGVRTAEGLGGKLDWL